MKRFCVIALFLSMPAWCSVKTILMHDNSRHVHNAPLETCALGDVVVKTESLDNKSLISCHHIMSYKRPGQDTTSSCLVVNGTTPSLWAELTARGFGAPLATEMREKMHKFLLNDRTGRMIPMHSVVAYIPRRTVGKSDPSPNATQPGHYDRFNFIVEARSGLLRLSTQDQACLYDVSKETLQSLWLETATSHVLGFVSTVYFGVSQEVALKDVEVKHDYRLNDFELLFKASDMFASYSARNGNVEDKFEKTLLDAFDNEDMGKLATLSSMVKEPRVIGADFEIFKFQNLQ